MARKKIIFEIKDLNKIDEKLYDEIIEELGKNNDVYIKIKDKLFKAVDYEPWDTICLDFYAEKHNIPIPNTENPEELEDFYWEILPEAIEEAKKEGKFDTYIYVDPYKSGEPFGVTIWLKKVSPKNPRGR